MMSCTAYATRGGSEKSYNSQFFQLLVVNFSITGDRPWNSLISKIGAFPADGFIEPIRPGSRSE